MAERTKLMLDRYAMLEDDWQVEGDSVFVSPLVKQRPGQIIIFGERVRNGSISADITILGSHSQRTGELAMEVGLLVRQG